MKRLIPTLLLAATVSLTPAIAANANSNAKKPNVLFIAIDDLRDWVGYLGNKQVKTPNLDKLAARGVAFTRSFCASPCCNPSRAALLSGLRPGTSGVYNNTDDWRKIVPDGTVTLPLHFKNNGYFVAGAGKIYHGGAGGFNRLSDWTDYMTKGVEPDSEAGGQGAGKRFQDDVGGVGGIRFGALDCDDRAMPDYTTVSYCLNQLKKTHDKPFFLACGLVKPHMAWSVPKKYFDMYPLDKIQLPKVLETDLDDVPPAGVRMAKPQGDHADIIKSGRWKDAVQAFWPRSRSATRWWAGSSKALTRAPTRTTPSSASGATTAGILARSSIGGSSRSGTKPHARPISGSCPA